MLVITSNQEERQRQKAVGLSGVSNDWELTTINYCLSADFTDYADFSFYSGQSRSVHAKGALQRTESHDRAPNSACAAKALVNRRKSIDIASNKLRACVYADWLT